MQNNSYDFTTLKGLFGAIVTIVLPFIDKINPVLQFIGMIAGITLATVSIYHKIQEIKKLKNGG